MTLTPDSVRREDDPLSANSRDIAVFTNGDDQEVQAIALVDENGDQAGTTANPLQVGGTILAAIKTAIEILDNIVSGSKALVTEDNSAAIKAAVETLDNIVSGSKALVTEDNSANILAALKEYGTNDVEDASATITYVGQEKADATWLVMKIDTSSGTAIRYATVTNNAGVATYAAAWAARASTLVYGTYAEAF